MKGDKTYCRIKSYMRETKTFITLIPQHFSLTIFISS